MYKRLLAFLVLFFCSNTLWCMDQKVKELAENLKQVAEKIQLSSEQEMEMYQQELIKPLCAAVTMVITKKPAYIYKSVPEEYVIKECGEALQNFCRKSYNLNSHQCNNVQLINHSNQLNQNNPLPPVAPRNLGFASGFLGGVAVAAVAAGALWYFQDHLKSVQLFNQ